MTLRDALRNAVVARCVPQAMQRATGPAETATDDATSMQRPPTPPSCADATDDATDTQRGSCIDPDLRVTCATCLHHRPLAFRCTNHRAAGLATSEVGPGLAALLQHCRAHSPLNRGNHD